MFSYLSPLDFELHVVLPGGLPVLPFLPAVSVASVADLLATVEQHGPAFWPGTNIRILLANDDIA